MSVGFLRNTSNSLKFQAKISYLFISYNVKQMFIIVTYIWELLEEINTNCLCIEYTGCM